MIFSVSKIGRVTTPAASITLVNICFEKGYIRNALPFWSHFNRCVTSPYKISNYVEQHQYPTHVQDFSKEEENDSRWKRKRSYSNWTHDFSRLVFQKSCFFSCTSLRMLIFGDENSTSLNYSSGLWLWKNCYFDTNYNRFEKM